MTYRKKKTYRKRRSRPSRYSNRNTSLQLTGPTSPMPTKFKTKLLYGDTFSLNPGSGVVNSYIFNATGMYDPNTTGVGHQPRGFDELMAMYDHYTVIGAKITLKFDNSANAFPVKGMVRLKDGTSFSSQVIDWQEDGYQRNVLISGNQGPAYASLTHTINPAKFLGRSKAMADPELKGSSVSNPAENAYFHVGLNAFGSTDAAAVNVEAKIEYICVLTEPKSVGSS